jgi:hypothetical protein
MKMGKRLLLCSAASLVAVGGAQAADLPVKAKPVEYVKICTLYGEGFYYIPGSDTCIKFGGYILADYGWNTSGAMVPGYTGTTGARDRTVSQYSTRHRANIQFDTRTQTDYGTLRTFSSVHFQNQDGTFSFNLARAFIQWAGFTFGRAQSFQDTWGVTGSWHYAQQQNNSDTSANGVNQIAYTWELGNGMTLTVGADEVRRKVVTDLSNLGAIKVGAEPINSYGGQRWPDPHIDFKVNQAWGYWATTFVAHDVIATYYDCTGQAANTGAPVTNCGHPNDKVGWAVQTGAEFKMDFINPGDRLGFGARYAQGASGFGGGSNLASPALFGSGNNLAVGWMTDGVFTGGTAGAGTSGSTSTGNLAACGLGGGPPPTGGLPSIGAAGITCNASQIELTTTWTVMAAYEHYWTPTLKTSLSGGYTRVEYDANAKAMWSSAVCGSTNFNTSGVITGGAQGSFNNRNSGVGGAGGPTSNLPGLNFGVGTLDSHCDPDWGFFQGGIRTQWQPSPGFLLGVDLTYTYVFTAFNHASAVVQNVALGTSSGNVNVVEPASGARPNGLYNLKNLGTFAAVFRAQRNFNAGD